MSGLKTGIVSNIQRSSLHDGPGIRSTLFLKGCNMRCAWCHNPEAIKFEPEIVYNPKACIQCGYCEDGCYTGARKLCGQIMDTDAALEELLRDKPYYGTDGGVTLSGGEPTMQLDFTIQLCEKLKKEGIHTAMETNLSIPFEKIAPLAEWIDLFMVDLKMVEEADHILHTGIGNRVIMENIQKLDKTGKQYIVRTPIIPGVNDELAQMEALVSFVAKLDNMAYYEVLPYHPLGLSKTVEGCEFIREFPLPDKEKIIAQQRELSCQYNIEIRVANKKI